MVMEVMTIAWPLTTMWMCPICTYCSTFLTLTVIAVGSSRALSIGGVTLLNGGITRSSRISRDPATPTRLWRLKSSMGWPITPTWRTTHPLHQVPCQRWRHTFRSLRWLYILLLADFTNPEPPISWFSNPLPFSYLATDPVQASTNHCLSGVFASRKVHCIPSSSCNCSFLICFFLLF